jgi:hypothetical protein
MPEDDILQSLRRENPKSYTLYQKQTNKLRGP